MTAETDAMRLVPVEPTEAMLWRGFDAKGAMTGLRHIHLIYRAMLSAAPAVQPNGGAVARVQDSLDTGTLGVHARADDIRAILAALAHPPAQGSESGGGRLGLVTQALVRADEEFGTALSAYRYRKLAEAVAAALTPQAGPASEGDP